MHNYAFDLVLIVAFQYYKFFGGAGRVNSAALRQLPSDTSPNTRRKAPQKRLLSIIRALNIPARHIPLEMAVQVISDLHLESPKA
jgi:hypothetical protein